MAYTTTTTMEKKTIFEDKFKKEDDTKSNQAESDREHEFKY